MVEVVVVEVVVLYRACCIVVDVVGEDLLASIVVLGSFEPKPSEHLDFACELPDIWVDFGLSGGGVGKGDID